MYVQNGDSVQKLALDRNGNLSVTGDLTVANGDLTVEEWNINGMGGATPPWDMNSAAHQVYLNDSTARVGIGTTAPSEKLEINVTDELHAAVKVSTDVTSAPHCRMDLALNGLTNAPMASMQITAPTDAGSEYLRFTFKNSSGNTYVDILNISRLGNVGIGTATVDEKLHVYGGKLKVENVVGSDGIIIEATSGGNSPFLIFKDDGSAASDKYGMRYDGTNNKFYLGYGDSTGFTPQITINQATGNVGIGVTNPNYPLSVAGVIEAQGTGYSGDLIRLGNDAKLVDINVQNTVGLYGLYDSTVGSLKLGSGGGTISGYNGCIGIGTVSPIGPLEVNGGTAVSGSGTPIKLKAQNAAAGSNGHGGNIILLPGSKDGAGIIGRLLIGSDTTSDAGNLVQIYNSDDGGLAVYAGGTNPGILCMPSGNADAIYGIISNNTTVIP